MRGMKREPIEVECYSGGRHDERPRILKLRGKTHRVSRLLGESVEENAESRSRIHRYRVMTSDGLILEITRDDQGWHLAEPLHLI